MTGILVGAVVALVGLSALLGGATVWLAKAALSRGDKRTDLTETVGELRLANEKFKTSVKGLDESLATKQEEWENEVAARKKAEEQRDRAISALAKVGDPDGTADAINADLGRLSNLS